MAVRQQLGEPLSEEAIVRIFTLGNAQVDMATTGGGRTAAGTASFGVGPGEYEIQVEAAGYKNGVEHATVISSTRAETVYVFLTPLGSSSDTAYTVGAVPAREVQKEVDKSLAALKQNKFDEARKHLEKARKMAPASPDVLYLMALLSYTQKDFAAARKNIDAVLAVNPRHERSLLMLAQMQLSSNEDTQAKTTLQTAVNAEANNWQAHYLLALALVRNRELERAELEATRAADLNKEKAPAMRLLRAKILMLQGQNSDAKRVLQSIGRDYPADGTVPEAKKFLDKIAESETTGATTIFPAKVAEAELPATIVPAYERPWAPPDVEAGIPVTAPGVSCATEDVLHSTQQQVLKNIRHMEEFSATEKVEHQVMDPSGMWSTPVSRDFEYLIFVRSSPTLPYYFNEDRNGSDSILAFPSAIATRGLVSLGFLITHPVFSKDFEFTCEGLGVWNGKPAWQLHFVQRSEVPSRIRSWTYKNATYPIALKGRIWIEANGYNLLHLETTLREPVSGVGLNREQLSVDYSPIRFQTAKTELWLPAHAEMYFDLRGHRYHHKHSLTNYWLFGVDTNSKIKAPLAKPENEDNDN